MKKKINSLRIAGVKFLKKLLSGVKFRGKGTLLGTLCPKDEVITLDLFGYAFDCDLSEALQRYIFIYDYDEEARAFIEKIVKPGDVFMDIGANVGYYTLLASRLVGPGGKVIAIEPNPKVFAKLQRTLARNNIENVLALGIGLGKEKGVLKLYFDSTGGHDTATMIPGSMTEFVQVEVLPLDDVTAAHQIEKISYLKIDVDGFEPDVFAGATNLLAGKKIDFIQSEFCDGGLRRNGSDPQTLHNLLTNAGFADAEGEPHFFENCLLDRFFIRR